MRRTHLSDKDAGDIEAQSVAGRIAVFKTAHRALSELREFSIGKALSGVINREAKVVAMWTACEQDTLRSVYLMALPTRFERMRINIVASHATTASGLTRAANLIPLAVASSLNMSVVYLNTSARLWLLGPDVLRTETIAIQHKKSATGEVERVVRRDCRANGGEGTEPGDD